MRSRLPQLAEIVRCVLLLLLLSVKKSNCSLLAAVVGVLHVLDLQLVFQQQKRVQQRLECHIFKSFNMKTVVKRSWTQLDIDFEGHESELCTKMGLNCTPYVYWLSCWAL